MDVLRMLTDLEEEIEAPRSILGFVRIDREDLVMRIAKIRATLPQEVKEAASTVREQERILGSANESASMTLEAAQRDAARIVQEAQAEAARLIEQARFEQEKLVSDSETLKLAKAQADGVRDKAQREALETRRAAEQYARTLLEHLERVTGKVLASIEAGKKDLAEPDAPAAPIPVRDRVRMG